MERIRQLRNEKGLSQAKLAVMADMDPATLNRLERGSGNPNLKTLERVADALGVEVADFFPKAQSSSPEPTFNDVLDDERRLHYLKPWPRYVNLLANNVEREIDQGHVADMHWWLEFNRDVISLINLFYEIIPPDEEQSEAEGLELLKFSAAIDRLEEVSEKMSRAMEPIIAEMHKELYARERERMKAAFNAIPGRRSA